MWISLNKEIALDAVIDIMVEKLNNGGTVTFTPNGNSMYPMLRDGKDVVVLSKPTGRLHLFDLPLYKRKNGGYVLHRVVDFDSDGAYVMCGDNQFRKEHGIYDEDIYGVVTSFMRKGKAYTNHSLRYRLYLNVWYYTRFFRHIFMFIKRRIQNIFDKKESKPDDNTTEQNSKT